jgi:5-(carboxyamino)imidazole ribonucleotide mutase
MIVGIIMGSASDFDIMEPALHVLAHYGVPYEVEIVSAHRSPAKLFDYAAEVAQKGISVIIAGAGGAAHLPGMMASITTVPVIGVPVMSRRSPEGWDALLSIAQMPDDVPVATVAINGAHNAALLAVQMLAIHDSALRSLLTELKTAGYDKVKQQNELIQKRISEIKHN